MPLYAGIREMSAVAMAHFGDPCIHCGILHDEVAPGPCMGDRQKAICIAYQSLGVRWDRVEHFLLLMSDGSFQDRWHHISENAPYYHFRQDHEFGSPPPFRQDLARLRETRRNA